MNTQTFDQNDHAEIENLLLGRRIISAEIGSFDVSQERNDSSYWPSYSFWGSAEGLLTLDDGTRIYVRGNTGCGGCISGYYSLEHLASVDNIITAVRFDDNPDSYYNSSDNAGWYRIFVFAGAEEINVATFVGTDGNGYYGTGYELYVQKTN